MRISGGGDAIKKVEKKTADKKKKRMKKKEQKKFEWSMMQPIIEKRKKVQYKITYK